MSKVVETVSLKHHEKLAKETFNKTWDFLDMKDRSPEEIQNMIHTVHASRYHWGILVSEGKGTALNLQRGDWILSRVYSVLGSGEPALFYATSCLELTEKNDIGDFDLAFAYEAMARASAALKNEEDFNKFFKLAKDAGEKIKKKDDRDYFFDELNGGKWFGLK
ncbi:MAG: hypothetical protein ACXAAH_16690 [Promethearchaeota archaeon]|jgi:hypothetical protein